MSDDFKTAVANLASGGQMVLDDEQHWKMRLPVEQPDGVTIDRLLREGWLEMMPNGGTCKISDAGLKAYLRSTDELGDGLLEMSKQP